MLVDIVQVFQIPTLSLSCFRASLETIVQSSLNPSQPVPTEPLQLYIWNQHHSSLKRKAELSSSEYCKAKTNMWS